MSRLRDLLIKRRSEVTPLIHWDFSGKSNADADTIVEDLTGNGYDLELKNFAFNNKSGYNGYPINLKGFEKVATGVKSGYDGEFPINIGNKVVFNGTIAENKISCGIKGTTESIVQTFAIKITGLGENQCLRWYNYKYDTGEPNSMVTLLYNGINFVDGSGTEPKYLGYYSALDGNVGKTLNNVTVEIFPLYPDQLVFNGINNFCQCTKDFVLPISRGYTWIAKYKNLGRLYLVGKGADAHNNITCITNADVADVIAAYSYGNFSGISLESFYNNGLSYVTSRFAGKQGISKGPVDDITNNKFVLGTIRPTESSRFFNGTMSEFYLFDRDLTQSQIEKFISDNTIPLPEVYYDVEKQGTLNEHTTKDKLIDFSGNENHGTLHNFTFDESNGWGYYPLDLVEGEELQSGNGWSKSGNKITITGTASSVIAYCSIRNVEVNNWTKDIVVPSFKCKVTGLDALKETQPTVYLECQIVKLDSNGNESKVKSSVSKDGIWEIPSYTVPISEKTDTTSLIRAVDLAYGKFVSDGEHQITVEFLPADEDCLRFSADKDTYVSLDTLTSGFKTVFMVFNPASMAQIIYDQRTTEPSSEFKYKFAIYGENYSIAWYARNTGGVTYINGELNNTKLASSLIGQKHCATLVNDTIEDGDTTTPIIGDRSSLDGIYSASMKFYKFLGFKEALSEKQIKMVIEKYNLNV